MIEVRRDYHDYRVHIQQCVSVSMCPGRAATYSRMTETSRKVKPSTSRTSAKKHQKSSSQKVPNRPKQSKNPEKLKSELSHVDFLNLCRFSPGSDFAAGREVSNAKPGSLRFVHTPDRHTLLEHPPLKRESLQHCIRSLHCMAMPGLILVQKREGVEWQKPHTTTALQQPLYSVCSSNEEVRVLNFDKHSSWPVAQKRAT